MKSGFLAIVAVVLMVGLGIGSAEAARIGGGKSVGMQRQAAPQPSAAPAQQVAPAAPKAPAAAPAPAPAPKRNWLGPIAGLAAGLGIAALASHLGFGEGLANALMIGLLVMVAIVVFRLIFRRPTAGPVRDDAMQYAGAGPASTSSLPQTQPSFAAGGAGVAASTTSAISTIPQDFDADGFLRVAKLNFVRLQAAHDAGNLADIREFVSPELFAEISLQISERGKASQQTDVVTLEAALLEVVTEGDYHIASVRFGGMIREAAGGSAEPFSEIWNLAKPVDGRSGWIVAGIQQMN